MTGGGPQNPQVEDQLRSILDAAGLGIFDYDVPARTVRVDRRARAVFGLDQQRTMFPIEDLLVAIHPDDRSRVENALDTAAHDLAAYSVEHRVCPPEGERWLEVHGQAVRNAQGGVRILGTLRDSTDLRSARDEVARVLEHAGEAFLSLSGDGRITYVNSTAERMLRRSRDVLLGCVPWQDVPGLLGPRFDELAGQAE